MFIYNSLYIILIILQFASYCFGGCRTTNDHKNHTCTKFPFKQISVTRSTRLELLRLRIYDCQEVEVKENILLYPKLENLTISCGTINNIHENALNFPNLQELDLSNNLLSHFGANVFKRLGQLQTLNISQNNFQELAQYSFSGLPNLKELILSGNKLSEFHPKVFDQIKMVRKLWLNYNEINFLPVRLLTKLRRLEYLDLSNNKIESFGEVFAFVFNLQYLNLSNNVIENVPQRAFQTTRLEVLDLSNNKLQVIYEDGLQLKTLRELYLQNNQIRLFEVSGLSMESLPLELLNVENNRLVFLEDDFVRTAKNLQTLKALKNPWDCQCWNKIEAIRRQFIRTSSDKDEDPLCVIGTIEDCKITKTSLEYYYNIYFNQLNSEDSL